MLKEFRFVIQNHKIKIVNRWLDGMKLYIDGECRDQSKKLLALSNQTLLSANLGELGILEIVPSSSLFSVELDAYLLDSKEQKLHVYSSHDRIPLKSKRLINN
ncbi:hypothetical protein RT723_06185 [Psychrosphaera aquimarina]|uniref:Uncharacterized protein n=1 Tax=Psychrosphaera aquimarina TaxID=2044854 RepID=A0ABU3QZX2_9GAMM|nr:hypothetical protein [Psychrosphaera aquimarina]MDU0112598.1 hypothetical protein [Psychrosphaera aquimarina]